ncbi:DUF4349 domain-containing protein [Streptomyces amakusaensis]|uniref:DUF4349 domain-containing protein n=1 Tax=Streptomyces amakusaensis TaxID=67271 RepID=A0ABW0AG85_9ACTN
MRARRTVTALALIGSLGLAGCSAGAESQSKDAAHAAEREYAPDGAGKGAGAARPEEAGAPAGEKRPDRAAAVTANQVIRTAEVKVRVKDLGRSLVAARRTAAEAGGHVAGESTERLRSTVVLRVPQGEYEAVLAELASGGRLLSRKAKAEDVADQVADVRSRVANQRASVARVRELMERAGKLSDVVALEEELSSRQAELESLLARQASLKDRTTLATVTLTLVQPEPRPVRKAAEKAEEPPGFTDALGGGWDALTASLRWGSVVIGAVAPFALVLGPLFAAWHWGVRPRLRGRNTAGEPLAPPSGPPSAPDGPDRG